uniref:Uncharacterized protein n=1 Tax=Plectus sambesii TaxID=2011161 RepID=A0A914X4C7_9BILA
MVIATVVRGNGLPLVGGWLSRASDGRRCQKKRITLFQCHRQQRTTAGPRANQIRQWNDRRPTGGGKMTPMALERRPVLAFPHVPEPVRASRTVEGGCHPPGVHCG